MRIVMTLVVRDEAEVLEDNLDYHLSRGVDFVIVTDHRSVDATPDILARYAAKGSVAWSRAEDAGFWQGGWLSEMARAAALEHGADWVINNDADEFWWPRAGDLKDALSRIPDDVGTVAAPRFNYMPSGADGPFWDTMTVRDEFSVNAIGRPLPSKRCHRGDSQVRVTTGMHRILSDLHGRPASSVPIEILHFPHRSLRQFEDAVAKHFETRKGREIPFTPRVHLGRLQRGGALRAHWDALVVTPQAVAGGSADARYRIDHRFRDYMRALRQHGAE